MAKGVITSAEIGERVRRARKALGLSVADLATRTGTDKGTISRIERGEAGISVERLQEIANALGMDPANLLHPPRGRRPPARRHVSRTARDLHTHD